MVAVGRTPGLPSAVEPGGVGFRIDEILEHSAHGIEHDFAEIDGDDFVLADLRRGRLARALFGGWRRKVPEIEFALGIGLVGRLN